MEAIFDRLKQLRRVLMLKQSDIASILMIKQNAYSMIETGKQDLSERNLKVICENYSVNPDWLREGKGEMFLEVDEEERQALVNALHKTTGYNREWIETGMGELLPDPLVAYKKADITDRFLIALEQLKISGVSYTEVAEKIEASTSLVSEIRRGKSKLTPRYARRFAEVFNVNPEWLFRGNGEMFLTKGDDKEVKIPEEKAVFIEHTDDIDYNKMSGSLVYNIDGTCGPLTRSFEDKTYIIGAINLPGFDRDMPVVQAKEDSMIPRINPNDYVGIQRVYGWDIIYWGKMHFVVMEDYRMFKILKKCKEDPECVILKSVNEEYDDIKVKKSDIVELYIVKKVLSLKTEVM